MGKLKRTSTVELNVAEISTILAALRTRQKHDCVSRSAEIESIATNDGECLPLNDEEIDELCMRINCGDGPSSADAARLSRLVELGQEVICDLVSDTRKVEIDELTSMDEISEGDDGTWVRAWVLVHKDRLIEAGLQEPDEDDDASD